MSGAMLKTAAIRDFSGGWNAADNPYNLSSKYQTISDNVVVGIDSAMAPRMGTKLFQKLKTGTLTTITAQAVTITMLDASSKVQVNWTAHGFSSGEHFTITSIGAAVANMPSIIGVHGVRKLNNDVFEITVRDVSTAAILTQPTTLTGVKDTHLLGGEPLDAAFFQNNLVVFSDIGEIVAIDMDTEVATSVWNTSLAFATAGSPTGWRGPLKHVSYDSFKQTLMVVNGKDNDKPIEINFNRAIGGVTQFLIDPATTSNAFVYPADFIQSFNSYTILYSSNNSSTPSSNTDTTVDISAAGTSGVYVGNTDPDDAVQIDLGRVTQTVEPRITGVASIRNKLFVGFSDSAMLGTLGIYSDTVHEPDFSDQIPQHGVLNHRVIQNIGNDLFMCDYAGVPAFTQSQQSGVILPNRLSQLIDPALNKHLSRLSADTLRYKVWAIFNIRDRQYMLFLPKHDSNSEFTGEDTPFFVVPEFRTDSIILVNAPNHSVSTGDYVVVSGATSITGLDDAEINGTRLVTSVVDENFFFMQVGAIPQFEGEEGGGSAVNFAPVDDETFCYSYQINPALRIKRWTRFRGWYFIAGALANDGRVFMVTPDADVFVLGTIDRPIYADEVDYYDIDEWTASTAYAVGDRLLVGEKVYICEEAHTSGATSFVEDTEDHIEWWSVYEGLPINWAAETPWSDFGDRTKVKVGEGIIFDVQGTDKFNLHMFVDNIYDEAVSYTTAPDNSLIAAEVLNVVGGNAPGFGNGSQSFGLGKRTREQLNYHFPFRCKLGKLRFSGSTTKPLRIVSVTMLYKEGSIYR
jgi:hypothetical protein